MGTNPLSIPEISLRYLKATLYVAQLRSVTHAGKKLNRSQTAVSKAIRELESQLDVPLFDRMSRGISTTVYGQALVHRVKLALDEFKAAGTSYTRLKKSERCLANNPLFSMEISYKRLAVLIALDQTCDYNGAAHILKVTPSAIYNSVRELERLLDLTLFVKSPCSVSPTAYCKVLVRHTKLAFSQIRHAVDDIAGLKGITSGQINIGTLLHTRTTLTPYAINRLLEQYPQLNVSTIEGPYDAQLSALRCGDIDLILGTVRPEESNPHLVIEKLFDDRLCVIARANHPLAGEKPLSPEALENLQWVLPPKSTPTRQLFEAYCALHQIRPPQYFIETSSFTIARGLLLESDRVALLSEHQVNFTSELGSLTPLPVDMEGTERSIGVTRLANIQLSPAALLFLESIRAVTKELRLNGRIQPASAQQQVLLAHP